MNDTYIYKDPVHLVLILLQSVLLLICTSPAHAALCAKWSGAEKVGELNYLRINEASGIAASSKYPRRLYHVNDSGGGAYFYITDMDGKNTRSVQIEGFNARRSDFEDLGLGTCFGGKTCLFIADIGDNGQKREFVEIIVVEELPDYQESITPIKRLRLEYTDRPHNAEGMAIHPNGDIFILTKEEDLGKSIAYPARLFKLEKEKWENSDGSALQLAYVGEIDFSNISSSDSVFCNVATSLDISPEGKRFLVLTYENVYEFDIDLSQDALKPAKDMKKGEDYNVIDIPSLPQQESISYADSGGAFIYDTEYKVFGVPIMRVECLDGRGEAGIN